MLKAKHMRQKASLAKQGSSVRNKTKKEGVCPVAVRSGSMGRNTEMLLGTVGRKFIVPKFNWS